MCAACRRSCFHPAMIFYFSGTGNSRHVARRIAQATGERDISIVRCLHEGTFAFRLSRNERVGLVAPVYFWGLPQIVIDFMSRLTLPDAAGHYIYTVATYGTSTGGFTHMARSLFARKGWPLRATYSVRMVDVWTPLFNVSNREKCLKITQNAEPQIDTAIHGICRNASGNFASRSLPWWLARWQYALYDRRRSTRYFKVNSRCTGCGLCARLCPTGSISINDSRPEWTKPRCTLCLSCLHHCPMSAIENGKASHRHGRFLHPDEGQSHG